MIYRKRIEPSKEHPILLGFSGKALAGKTTAAHYIKGRYNGEVIAFADSLKAGIYDLNEIRGSELGAFLEYAKSKGEEIDFHAFPKSDMYNPKRKDKIEWINENKVAFRRLMQIFGDYKRDAQPLYFVEKTLKATENLIAAGTSVICIDDVRYLNEVSALEEIDFTIVRVNASDEVRAARGHIANDHASETQLDALFHQYHVYNNLEPFEMYRQLDEIISQILNKEYE